MKAGKVDASLWPSEQQMKDQRKRTVAHGKHYSFVCVGALDHFLRNLPEGIHLFREHVVCNEHCVRIPFATQESLRFAQSCALPCLILDFAFNTNGEGLLLGGAGPVGLRTRDHLPHMRFVPVVFVLADGEDEAAHRLLLGLLFSLRSSAVGPFTDVFCDCSCFASAFKHCGDRIFFASLPGAHEEGREGSSLA